MNSYEETIKSLTEVKTIASHLTAFGKIRAKSEDEFLIQLIENLIRELQSVHVNNKKKSTPISLDKSSALEVVNLIKYCKKAIGSKKHEWQILAERNGWTPPPNV